MFEITISFDENTGIKNSLYCISVRNITSTKDLETLTNVISALEKDFESEKKDSEGLEKENQLS